jgi:AcrR family transcriptional regulator
MRFKSQYKLSLRDTSLPWEILETARFCFQKKGFEKTTILNICERLGIKKTQFHKYFKSLDEVLEILWAM